MAADQSDADAPGRTDLEPLQKALLALPEHFHLDVERINRRSGAAPGSGFARDEAAASREIGRNGIPWQPSVVQDVLDMASLGVNGASYGLFSIGRLLEEPVSRLAAQALTRSILERSARAWWLLEPEITCRERVSRAVADALHTTREEERALSRAHKSSVRMDNQGWADQALKWARDLGLPLTDRTASPTLVGFQRLGSARLVNEILQVLPGAEGAVAYGYLSAAVHGAPLHGAKLGGPSIEVRVLTLGELAQLLSLPVVAVRESHCRLAGYLGASSRARAKPYDEILAQLRELTEDPTPVGVL